MINTKNTTHMPHRVNELRAIFLLTFFSHITSVQSGERLEAEEQLGKVLTVEDVLGKNVIDWPFYGGLIVLPPQNKTGDPELDWVSIAIQDAMTIDLWYVKAFETLALPQLSSIYKTSCPKLKLACVQNINPETASAALKGKVPSYIVQGTYHLDGGKLLISLNLPVTQCSVNDEAGAQLSGDSKKAHSHIHPAYWAPYRILGTGE